MSKKKKSLLAWTIASSIVFLISSITLFVNELTQFFANYGLKIAISVLTWSGIALSITWYLILFAYEKR